MLLTSTTSNADGICSVTLESGSYDIEIEQAGYITARADGLVLPVDGSLTTDLQLRFDSACIVSEPELLFTMLAP